MIKVHSKSSILCVIFDEYGIIFILNYHILIMGSIKLTVEWKSVNFRMTKLLRNFFQQI